MDFTTSELSNLATHPLGQLVPTAPTAPLVQPAKVSEEAAVTRVVHGAKTLLYIRDANLYYYQEADTYKRLPEDELMVWVRDIWTKLFSDNWTAAKIKQAMEKVKMATEKRIPTLDRRFIKIGPDCFWDVETANFSERVLDEHNCFCQLFDSDKKDNTTIKVPPLTPAQVEQIKRQHRYVLETLESTQTLPEEYQFVTTWACGEHDVYMDMLKCHAFTFMETTKTGSPILIGHGGNGKSVYLDLLHSIWGRNNTTTLTMQQMSDPHHQLSLGYSFFNAPDEEQGYSTEKERDTVQRVFKILSARGRLSAEKFFSQEDTDIVGNFVSFFPMNHKPSWRGDNVSALVRRSLIVPFNAELSHLARRSGNFFHDTFTPDVLCHYLGTLLGIASYYHAHDLQFSPTMQYHQAQILAENDSTMSYKQEFELFFDSFQSMEMLEKDYQLWCDAMGYVKQPLGKLKWAFDKYLDRNHRTKCRKEYAHMENGHKVQPSVFRAQALKGKEQMVEGYKYPGCGEIGALHSDSLRTSLVAQKAKAARQAYGDNYREVLRPRAYEPAPPPPEPPEQPPLVPEVDDIFNDKYN